MLVTPAGTTYGYGPPGVENVLEVGVAAAGGAVSARTGRYAAITTGAIIARMVRRG
jgi:hypothetical protein